MITQTQTKADAHDRFDLQAVASRFAVAQRETADRLLDLYQETVGRLADAHVKRAHAVELPAAVTLAESHAALSRDVADAYVRSVRKLLEH
jgi:hypothetical protein